MIKAILCAFVLASCSSKPLYPTDTTDEQRWLQEYRDGKIGWTEYQQKLAAEREVTPTPTSPQ